MGWNGSAQASSGELTRQPSDRAINQSGKKSLRRIYLIAGAAIVVLGGIAFLWMPGTEDESAAQTDSVRVISDKAKSVSRPSPLATNALHREKKCPSGNVQTNASMPPVGSGTNQNVLAQNQPPPPRKPVKPRYKSITEFTLAMFFSTKLGDPPPPLPPLPEHELDKIDEIINRPTEIDSRDGPTMRERKQICDLAKAEFKKFIEEGGDDIEFFDYYRKKLNQYHREWQKGQDRVESLYNAGLKDEAAAVAKEINDDFTARGIKAVELPVEQ